MAGNVGQGGSISRPPRSTTVAGSARRGPEVDCWSLFGLDHEVDLQLVLNLHGTAEGTDRLNPIIGLFDPCSADASSV